VGVCVYALSLYDVGKQRRSKPCPELRHRYVLEKRLLSTGDASCRGLVMVGNVSCDEPARGVELPITSALWLGLLRLLKTTSVWYVHGHSSTATSFEDQARGELHMAARVHDCAPGQGSGHETCPFSVNSGFASSECM
jgi:hypothetical protein